MKAKLVTSMPITAATVIVGITGVPFGMDSSNAEIKFCNLNAFSENDFLDHGLPGRPRLVMLNLSANTASVLYAPHVKATKYRRRPMTIEEHEAYKTIYKEFTGIDWTGSTISVNTMTHEAPDVISSDPIITQIHNTPLPAELFMNPTKWKYMVRNILRGQNIMFVGPSGAGKTQAAKSAAKVLGREFFKFDMGATQDPKSYLLGNMHYEKDKGTLFRESKFIEAIQTTNAIVFLDELSRAHPDAWNVLLPILDPIQKSIILDEHPDKPVIKVADGVSFIATANIGSQFTATRVMDEALRQRFVYVEMDPLKKSENMKLIKYYFSSATKSQLEIIGQIADFAEFTLKDYYTETPKLSVLFSTRQLIQAAGLVIDGFTLPEIVDTSIATNYSMEGGTESERAYVYQFFQKFGVSMK